MWNFVSTVFSEKLFLILFILFLAGLCLLIFYHTKDDIESQLPKWLKWLKPKSRDLAAWIMLSLIGHVLVAYLSDNSIKLTIKKELETNLTPIAEKAIKANMPLVSDYVKRDNQSVTVRGLVAFHPSGVPVQEFLASAVSGDSIYVNVTYVAGFVKYRDALQKMIARGVSFKFLLLDPASKVVEYRAAESGRGDYQVDLAASVKALEEFAKQNKNNVEDLLYDDLPGDPFFLLVRNGRPISACLGTYLFSSSESGMWFTWKDTGHEENVVRVLFDYFESKIRRIRPRP